MWLGSGQVEYELFKNDLEISHLVIKIGVSGKGFSKENQAQSFILPSLDIREIELCPSQYRKPALVVHCTRLHLAVEERCFHELQPTLGGNLGHQMCSKAYAKLEP